jgi:hypothetical protein
LITMTLCLMPILALAQTPLAEDKGSGIPASGQQYVLQVGAFADSANASRLVERLQQNGFPSLTKAKGIETGDALTLVLAGRTPTGVLRCWHKQPSRRMAFRVSYALLRPRFNSPPPSNGKR